MQSQTEQIINKLIRPIIKSLSQFSMQNLTLLIQQTRTLMTVREFDAHLPQWKILAKKLNSNDKLTYLKQQNCRKLLIELIKEDAMHLFNFSYLNRAKIDDEYIRYLKELGPYFFIEVIMVVSKLKTIHKHFYYKLSKVICENHITLKIVKILELCNQRKRSVNNNKAKFLCVVEEQADRLQITKELGKMLREAWKREKSKPFEQLEQFSEMLQEPIQNLQDELPVRQVAKQMVKQGSYFYQEQYDFDLSEQLLNFNNMPQHTYRYSDTEELLIG